MSGDARPAAPLALIASVARNGRIGVAGGLVWREPADQRWFRQQTLGCPVVMGRKTWDSLPARFRPLPGRRNIVVTRQPGWAADGAEVAHTVVAALALARSQPASRIFVIGGATLYAAALPLADELVLTEIDTDLPGDTSFPTWDRSDFAETRREAHHSEGPPACDYAFVFYQRQRPQR